MRTLVILVRGVLVVIYVCGVAALGHVGAKAPQTPGLVRRRRS